MISNVKPSPDRARQRAHALQYAPRAPIRPTGFSSPVEDIRLRRLTAQVLEALKRPDAIPSRVLMDALAQAKALGSS